VTVPGGNFGCMASPRPAEPQAAGRAVKVVANNLEARRPEVRTHGEAVPRLKRRQIEAAVTDIAEWGDQGERLTRA
jgi:hypothetical protein